MFSTQTLGLNPQVLSSAILKERIINNFDLYQNREQVTHLYFYGAGCGVESPQLRIRKVFNEIFKNDICNTVYIKNQMTFFLPIMHTNKDKFEKMMWNAKYNVYCVQMRALSGETVNVNYINKNKKMIFIARPQIKSDIYELYVENNSNSNSKEEYYGIAYIDSYKTSIMMNNVFRNIKENKDLDKIEESDSEEEFEDISLDKYIIKKEAKILCEYNQTLRGWVPIKELV